MHRGDKWNKWKCNSSKFSSTQQPFLRHENFYEGKNSNFTVVVFWMLLAVVTEEIQAPEGRERNVWTLFGSWFKHMLLKENLVRQSEIIWTLNIWIYLTSNLHLTFKNCKRLKYDSSFVIMFLKEVLSLRNTQWNVYKWNPMKSGIHYKEMMMVVGDIDEAGLSLSL